MASLDGLAGLFASLRLVPSRIVLHQQNGDRVHFLLKTSWDGKLRLRKAAQPTRKGRMLVVLEANLLYRRLLRVPARHRITRNLLLASAVDAFPFDVDEGVFALGERDGKQYVVAMDDEAFANLRRESAGASGFIVSAGNGVDDVLQSISGWLKDGKIRDFLGRPSPLKPAYFLMTIQAVALIGCLMLGFTLWSSRQAEAENQARAMLSQKERAAAALLEKRRAVFRMVEVEKATTDLQAMPGGHISQALGDIFAALPPGARIDRLRLSGAELKASGWGDAPASLAQGRLPVTIDVQDLPEADRFELTIELDPEKARRVE